MNAKYYPKMKYHALLTKEVISTNPFIIDLDRDAKKPQDYIVPVYNTLCNLGYDDKDDALEVCKMFFYGWYIEVCEYYGEEVPKTWRKTFKRKV